MSLPGWIGLDWFCFNANEVSTFFRFTARDLLNLRDTGRASKPALTGQSLKDGHLHTAMCPESREAVLLCT